jgi:hypothetical protein
MKSEENHKKTPWHLWVIGVFFFSLYSVGVYDYFMMLGLNEAYYSYNKFGEEVFAYFNNYPLFPQVFWAANVFSGIAASILLLFSSRWVVQASFVSAVSIILLHLITSTFMGRLNALGTSLALFDVAIMIITISFYFYCKTLDKRGVLR